MGVTGARAQTSSAAPALVARIRAADPAAMVGRRPRGLQRRPGARGHRLRRCGDRRLRAGRTLLDAEDAGTPGRPQRAARRGRRPGGRRSPAADGRGNLNLADVRLRGARVSRTAMRAVAAWRVGLLMLVSGCTRPTRAARPATAAPTRRAISAGPRCPQPVRDARRHPHRHRRPAVQPGHLAVAAGHLDVLRLQQVPRRLHHGAVRRAPWRCSGWTPAERDHIQVIFVTTDPARDKPAVIRRVPRPLRPELRRPDRVAGHHQAGGGPGRGGHRGHEEAAQRRLRGRPLRRRSSASTATAGVVLWTPETPIADLKHDFALLVEQVPVTRRRRALRCRRVRR